MNAAKRKRLEAKGWKVGNTTEFLNLSPAEAEFIELKVTASKALKDLRISKKFSQVELAKRINSSQSRVAKMEAADKSVSMDLMLHAMFELGASKKQVVGMLAG